MTSQTTNAGNVEVWYDDAVARRGNLLELLGDDTLKATFNRKVHGCTHQYQVSKMQKYQSYASDLESEDENTETNKIAYCKNIMPTLVRMLRSFSRVLFKIRLSSSSVIVRSVDTLPSSNSLLRFPVG